MTSASNGELDGILQKFYYQPRSPIAFANAKAVYNFLKKEGHNFTQKSIREWIGKQDVQQRHKSVPVKFPRRHTYVSSLYDLAQADLMDVSSLRGWNAQTNFILLLINVFSRKIYVRPLRNKTAAQVAEKLDDILKNLEGGAKFKHLQTDKGKSYSCLT